jgi:hypothetical protein
MKALTMRKLLFRNLPMLLATALVAMVGCGNGLVSANPSNSAFYISPGVTAIDTNCTGCNATNAQGGSIHQFTATLTGGGAAQVAWSLSGGDAVSGPGTITASGQYTPPSYLTADRVEVLVTATLNARSLNASPAATATSVLTVTPGFLQPLTPENLSLGANGSVTITGYLAEAGGSTAIDFALANSAPGSSAGPQSQTAQEPHSALGTLGAVNCKRDSQVFTSCTVTYTAPATIPASGATYVVATAGASSSRTSAAVLLNAAGVNSNPATHQAQLPAMIQLGVSGGNNNDYDLSGNRIADCCSGTLGALIEDSGNRLYLLSNNHVLARSDQASVGDSIIQPGLIDNNCTPNGVGPGVATIATLNGWLPLSSKATNADAAIAQVASRAVDSTGSILELGARQPDGTLAAAPPGISSSNGRGETAVLDLIVAKSGRTTGLTCGSITALDLDVSVDYFYDCAETRPYRTKTFTNQLAVSGNAFSDAGDSGALLVDAANAEPVGLFFAGGRDASGVSQAIANPAGEVLSELGAQAGGGIAYNFVGAADHPVSCLNYGDSTIAAAQAHVLTSVEIARGQLALAEARSLVNPSAGILGVATGKSSDHPGEAAVVIYTDEGMTVTVPAAVGGVRTVAIPTTAHALAFGQTPQREAGFSAPALTAAALNQAIAVKQQVAPGLMKRNSAFFGVGVGQSLDNPREAALVVYVDRQRLPAQLPATVDGLRTRYVVMDRLHVTRSYATAVQSRAHCMSKPAAGRSTGFDLLDLFRPRSLKLN